MKNDAKTAKGNKRKIWILILAIAGILLLIGAILFYICIYPIFQFLMGVEAYEGKELYEQQAYLEYENGENFQGVIQKLDFAKESDVQFFLYWDTVKHDHLWWGKCPDIYILDLYVGEKFDEIYRQYWDETKKFTQGANYELMFYDIENVRKDYNKTYFLFVKDKQLVRVIYQTDTDDDPYDIEVRRRYDLYLESDLIDSWELEISSATTTN